MHILIIPGNQKYYIKISLFYNLDLVSKIIDYGSILTSAISYPYSYGGPKTIFNSNFEISKNTFKNRLY